MKSHLKILLCFSFVLLVTLLPAQSSIQQGKSGNSQQASPSTPNPSGTNAVNLSDTNPAPVRSGEPFSGHPGPIGIGDRPGMGAPRNANGDRNGYSGPTGNKPSSPYQGPLAPDDNNSPHF